MDEKRLKIYSFFSLVFLLVSLGIRILETDKTDIHKEGEPARVSVPEPSTLPGTVITGGLLLFVFVKKRTVKNDR